MNRFRMALPRGKSVAPLFAAVLLAGFMAFLISGNYLSQKQVQHFALADLHLNLDKRATAISYFFSERRNDLNTLATSSEIVGFFQNKALGMTMEYGLKASLVMISEAFARMLEQRKLGSEAIYARLLLLDDSGEVFVDSTAPSAGPHAGTGWEKAPAFPALRVLVDSDRGRSHALISEPCYLEDRYLGRIFAWVPLQPLYDHFIRQPEGAFNRGDFLLHEDNGTISAVTLSYGNFKLPDYFLKASVDRGAPGQTVQRSLGERIEKTRERVQTSSHHLCPFCTPLENEANVLRFAENGIEFLAVPAPIRDTPFSLLKILPEEEVFGATRPWHLLMALGALALLLLGGVHVIWRNNANTLILRARLEETTERESAIEAINVELHREIRERERAQRALEKAKEAAEAASRAKSEFLANMSHELRTPLNAIIGLTDMMQAKKCGDLTTLQHKYLGIVLRSANHLLSLISDILDLTKMEAGKLDLELAEIEPEKLLLRSLTILKEKAQAHNIKLSAETGGLPAHITADERKLKQVLYNLLSNAIKFTPAGGEVRLRSELSNGSVLVSVEDSGIGIKEEDLERIFDPFEQADSSPTRKYQGTGLGLSLSRVLIEMHGGKIWAESAGEGKGAAFRFLLPRILKK